MIHRDLHRVADVVGIIQRLTHPHQHDVGQKALVGGVAPGMLPFAKVITADEDLADNLTRCQVAHQLLRARMAERAGQGAANLGRDAERAAIFFGDVDRLNLMPAINPQKVFARAVDRDLPRDDLWPGDAEVFGQKGAEVLGKVRHQIGV